jgi:hypothetical protein
MLDVNDIATLRFGFTSVMTRLHLLLQKENVLQEAFCESTFLASEL